MCDEINTALNALPDGLEITEQGVKSILEAVSQTLVILTRYLELLSLQQKAVPAVLLPAINTLRLARKAPVLGEGYFFQFSFKPSKVPSTPPLSHAMGLPSPATSRRC